MIMIIFGIHVSFRECKFKQTKENINMSELKPDFVYGSRNEVATFPPTKIRNRLPWFDFFNDEETTSTTTASRCWRRRGWDGGTHDRFDWSSFAPQFRNEKNQAVSFLRNDPNFWRIREVSWIFIFFSPRWWDSDPNFGSPNFFLGSEFVWWKWYGIHFSSCVQGNLQQDPLNGPLNLSIK